MPRRICLADEVDDIEELFEIEKYALTTFATVALKFSVFVRFVSNIFYLLLISQ